MQKEEDNWFLLRVRPRYENIASEFIKKNVAGSDVYYPVAERDGISLAVFPGYIYARFLTGVPNLTLIREHCSARPAFILRLLRGGVDEDLLIPISVPDKQITELQLEQLSGVFNVKKDPFTKYLIGTDIIIPCGMFRGYKGRIQSIHNDLVKVRLNMLNSRFYISLTIDDVLAN